MSDAKNTSGSNVAEERAAQQMAAIVVSSEDAMLSLETAPSPAGTSAPSASGCCVSSRRWRGFHPGNVGNKNRLGICFLFQCKKGPEFPRSPLISLVNF
ncbi:hypothetical protein, partial [Ensifer adhaerens]|uniref:hypothetical protein n=1 Tax=Ensifer adhaerens TaxID=106592 RepID=UPI001AEC81F9